MTSPHQQALLDNDCLTIPMVAKQLGLDPRTIRRLIKSGALRKIPNLNRSVRITREALDRFKRGGRR
jgi:excisionase family DNA binding protein